MTNLLDKAKEVLSILPTSTSKDNEIQMLINSAIKDMNRLNINVADNINDDLIVSAIMMYVKAYFGNTNVREKELCQKSYSLFLSNIANTQEYLSEDDTNDCYGDKVN